MNLGVARPLCVQVKLAGWHLGWFWPGKGGGFGVARPLHVQVKLAGGGGGGFLAKFGVFWGFLPFFVVLWGGRGGEGGA